MQLTQPQATAIRACIESGGKARFSRSFFSGKELPRGTIPAITARKLASLGLGRIQSGEHKDEGTFFLDASGESAYKKHRERLLKENNK